MLRIFLIVTGALTVLAFAPFVLTIGVYMLLPGLLLSIAPNFFILGLVAACGNRRLRFLDRIPRLIATLLLVAVVPLASAGLAAWYNHLLELKWQRLVQDDHTWNGGRFTARRLAILSDGWASGGEVDRCDEFCQKLLYSGTAQSVSVGLAKAHGEDMAPTLTQAVTRFSIEHRNSCPIRSVVFGPDGDSIRQKIAAGDCPIGAPDEVSSSDAIITRVVLAHDEGPVAPSGRWALTTDTLAARRTTVHVISDGKAVELFRKTEPSAEFFPGLVALGAVSDGHAGFEIGLFRWQRRAPGSSQLPTLLWSELGFHPGPVTGAAATATRRP